MPVDAVPLLVTVAESVTAVPLVAAVGVTVPAVRSGISGALTVTAVHAPQLFPSLLSAMVPTEDALLSAQTRTYHVPTDGKVYDRVAALLVPAVRIGFT